MVWNEEINTFLNLKMTNEFIASCLCYSLLPNSCITKHYMLQLTLIVYDFLMLLECKGLIVPAPSRPIMKY